MKAWKIQLLRTAAPDHQFAHELLYLLVEQGARYNAGEYPGDYWVIPEDLSKQVNERESEERIGSERLGEIVETYGEFDETSTEFAVSLAYTVPERAVHFTLGLLPIDESKHYVKLEVPSYEIDDSTRFRQFVSLCRSVFETFDFAYGSYRTEYNDDVPTRKADLRTEQFRQVTFLPSTLSEEFGAETLLNAPAMKTERLENGGVMILVCDDPVGCGQDVREVNRYLGL